MKALKRILALLMAVALLTGSVAVYAEQPESAGDIVEEAPIAAGLTEADVPEAGLLELAGGDDDPEAGEPDADPDDAPAETADGAADDGESEPEDADGAADAVAPQGTEPTDPVAGDDDAADEGADLSNDADAPEIVAADAPEMGDGSAVDDEGAAGSSDVEVPEGAGAPADADAPEGAGPSDPAAGDGDAPDEDEAAPDDANAPAEGASDEDAPGGDADGADETEDGDEQTDGVGATLTAFVDDADADWDGTATLQVRCEYTGAGELSYRWQRLDENDEAATWTDLPDGTEDSLYIADAATEAGAAFRCVVTDGELTAASEAAHVFAAPPMLAGDIRYSGTWGSLSWTLDADGVLTISGSGAMNYFTYSSTSAWRSYKSSIKSVVIGQGVTSIGAYAFYSCNNLTSVTIPKSVTYIGYEAFEFCSSLTSVTIPSSVTSIGSSAFQYCSSLTSATIPVNASIGSDAFYRCNIKELTISGSGAMRDYAYSYSWDSSKSSPWGRSVTSVVIEPGVTSIGSSAFYDCSSLTSVTIPDSVTSIGSRAFEECSSLTSVTIPSGVTSIGSSAFYKCSSLTSVTIPESVTSIESLAFYGCSSLASVHISSIEAWLGITFSGSSANPCSNKGATLYISGSAVTDIVIPTGVTSIGDYAFEGCSSLTGITIPTSVTSIGRCAFYKCSSLVKKVTIPSSVTSIGDYAFEGCSSVTRFNHHGYEISCDGISSFSTCGKEVYSIKDSSRALYIFGQGPMNGMFRDSDVMTVEVQNGVTSIDSFAFDQCRSLTSITIPDSVTSIGEHAFYFCDKLTSIRIPDRVTDIGDCAFASCKSLSSVTFAYSATGTNSLKNIGAYAFDFCDSLTSIEIPPNVKCIENCAFYGCDALKTVILPNALKKLEHTAFDSCNAIEDILIPRSAVIYCDFYDTGCELEWDAPNTTVYLNSNAHKYFKKHGIAYKIAKMTAISPTSLKLNTGEQRTLTMEITHPRAQLKITYSSSNAKVATVSKAGVITAKKPGTARITVNADGVKATCTVTVLALPKSVILSAPRTQLSVGDGVQTVCTFNKGAYAPVTYESSDESVITVDEAGYVSAAGAGEATVTVTTSNGVTGTLAFEIAEPPTGVALTPDSAVVLKGSTIQLSAEAVGGYSDITYTSADEAIATVDAKGVVKGVGGGRTTITATTYNGESAPCSVTVFEAKIHLESTVFAVYDTLVPELEHIPGDVDEPVTWTVKSSNAKIVKAVETEEGWTLKAVKAGKATVTAIASTGAKASVKLTVKKAAKKGWLVVPAAMGVGESVELGAKSDTCAYATIAELEERNDEGVITVEDGIVTANAPGTAQLRAKLYNGKWTPWAKITVKEAPVDGDMAITLQHEIGGSGWYDADIVAGWGTIEVAKGDYANARLVYSNDKGGGYTAYSTDTSVLTVSKGRIRFVGFGEASVIYEAYNGAAASLTFNVKAAPRKIKIEQSRVTKGERVWLWLDGVDEEYTYIHMKASSSKKRYATVGADYCDSYDDVTSFVVKGKKLGKTKITVKLFNGVKASKTIKVTKNKITVAGKPSKGLINACSGDYFIYLKSLEVVSSRKLVAEYYFVNGLSYTATGLKNGWDAYLYFGEAPEDRYDEYEEGWNEEYEIADKYFKSVKFKKKIKRKSYGTFKVTFTPDDFYEGYADDGFRGWDLPYMDLPEKFSESLTETSVFGGTCIS